ncbi:uncharacterized protein SRS1_10701 [Sporisorium reilianum f. sp. reilianum]|uniref:PXA domain-containing protein n=1 Tax=Sporisorium reilianum f. sp. reilianum TaxID=72559 RepID=A0A2N8UB95_9BASI|nr:uncharacterized protein SRS1_10701 [Sporisorium reilianum f. sp. reilianum]
MAREPLRRGATSPSPLSSPTPSAVAAFGVRKDTTSSSSPFVPSAAFRDVASPLSASHASLSTNPVLATLSPRPMSPTAYRIDSTSTHNDSDAFGKGAARQLSNDAPAAKTSPSTRPAPVPSSSSTSSSTRTDKAAERAFYRRILFQDLSPSTPAPSITHDADLDHEIYLLLAYLLRETVLPWYSKLTPDREFLTQITSIITSIIHAVVERQTAGDAAKSVSAAALEGDIHASRSAPDANLFRVQQLLSRDIPLILQQHCSDFRQAQSRADSVWAPLGPQPSLSMAPAIVSQSEHDQRRRQQAYEQLPSHYQQVLDAPSSASAGISPLLLAQHFYAASPHPGLDATTGSLDGKIDLAYLRIAVLNLLSSLLSADEYAPDTERFIVRDVLVTVLRGALARSFRPWFFVQSIHKVLDAAGWASDPVFPPTRDDDASDQPVTATSHNPHVDGALSSVLSVLARLPAILLQAWSFLVLTALPFLVRAYLDLFNVHRARKRRLQHPQNLHTSQDGVGSLKRSSSLKGDFPSSLSTGSLVERNMHGRYPSRKLHFSNQDTMTAQGHSSAIESHLAHTQHVDLTQALHGEAESNPEAFRLESVDEADLPPDYVANWLDAAEEVLQTSSHAVLRSLFGLARTLLITTGLAGSVNRMTMRRINAELRHTQKLTRAVRELRRILLPDGHLPPSVADPDVETQEAEWIRLRLRLVSGAKQSSVQGEEAFLPWLVKKMLLGSADGGLRRGDAAARKQDTQIQLQRLTTWLEPFCSAQAAGPNTLLSILLLERVIVVLCPDLTLA